MGGQKNELIRAIDLFAHPCLCRILRPIHSRFFGHSSFDVSAIETESLGYPRRSRQVQMDCMTLP